MTEGSAATCTCHGLCALRAFLPTSIIPVEHTTGAITLEDEAKTPDRLMELPPKTREFLARLDEDDIQLLEQGIKLIGAFLTVGGFVKWVIILTVSILVGFVMVWENVAKLLRLISPSLPK